MSYVLFSYGLVWRHGKVVTQEGDSTVKAGKGHQTSKNVRGVRRPGIPLQTPRQRGLPTVMRQGIPT